MNLLAGTLYDPATAVTKATTAALAMTAVDTTNLRLTFTVPLSGRAWVRVCGGALHGATTYPNILVGILNGATVVARVQPIVTVGGTALATTPAQVFVEFLVTGLTPGASLTWDLAYGVETLVASTGWKYGGPNNTTANDAWGGISFEVWDPSPIYLPTVMPALTAQATATAIKAKTDSLTFTTALKVDAAFNAAADFPQAAADKVWSTTTRALTDKVGFALSAAGVQAIWDALTSALTTVGSVGKLLVDNVNATISSRSTYAGADTSGTTTLLARIPTFPTNFSALSISAAGLVDILQSSADKVWSSATRTVTSLSGVAADIRTALGMASANLDTQLAAIASYIDTEVAAIKAKTDQITFTVANKVDSTIQLASDFAQGAADKVWSTTTRALTDKVGFALSSAGVQAIWDALTSALTTVGSVGKRIADNLDATISSRSTYAGADSAGVTTLLARLTGTRATNLDNLDATVSSRSTYAGADTGGTTTLLSRVTGLLPLASDYSAARAAKLDNLDATVSSRSTYAGADSAGVTTLLGRVPGVVPVAADYTATRALKLDHLDADVSSVGGGGGGSGASVQEVQEIVNPPERRRVVAPTRRLV